MNHLTHIWQLVVRHEHLFYTSRCLAASELMHVSGYSDGHSPSMLRQH